MDEIEKKKKAQVNELPHDLIEEHILYRLPVKSLLRFKAVSKQWKAIISDPRFAETHLRRSKSSGIKRFLAQRNDAGTPQLAEICRKGQIRLLSPLDFPPELCLKGYVLCHCDGLYLSRYFNLEAFILFNPSNRTCTILSYPYLRDSSKPQEYGICYDPLTKDYKVVIGDYSHYAVFYCKTETWSERKETTSFSCNDLDEHCPFKVSFYWAFRYRDPKWAARFDGRDDKFRMVRSLPVTVDGVQYMHPVSSSSGDCLYLFSYSRERRGLVGVKTVGCGGEWKKVKVIDCKLTVPSSCSDTKPAWGDKILGQFEWAASYGKVSKSEELVGNIQNHSNLKLFPYAENLFVL